MRIYNKEVFMSKLSFPSDFLWGAATASFQVEGAGREDGRSDSIWDTFCRTPGKVHAGDNGDVACDQYHRYAEDIAIMKSIGIQAYRFSIAWPRILPQGTGTPNQAGLDYYKRLIQALKAAGIKPVATLYHWDLPQVLQDSGGWANRATAVAFAAYARICYEALGDELDTWITINEPLCVAYLGHLHGYHAPGFTDSATAYRVVHHLNLAHGLAVKAFRDSGKKGSIGIVWNLATPRPATVSAEDRAAVERVIDHESRMFSSPILGKGYPDMVASRGIQLPIQSGDLDLIAKPIDFIGVNYYAEHALRADDTAPLGASGVPSWQAVSEMGWPVVPQGLLRQLRWIAAEAPGIPLYITENGFAGADAPVLEADGSRRVHDSARIEYLHGHLAACSAAIAEGIPLKGYFLWSFIDNFEWAWGYSRRFGIVYCDFQTLERIPKDSCYWYRDLIAGYGD
jgi:beta-glucosidase